MNKLAEKGAFISKSEAAILQAVAVMLMVWHHLFGFPDRINVPYVLVFDRLFHIETIMGYFGRICVAVFAFVSGYGMRKKAVNSGKTKLLSGYHSIASQLLKSFSRYWAVFCLFIPIGFLLKVYPVDGIRFLKGLLGNGVGYNGEWWYVDYYIRLLLLFPVVTLLADVIQRYVPFLVHILIAAAIVTVAFFAERIPNYGFVTVLLCFAQGMYFVDNRLFETLYQLFLNKSWFRLGTGSVLFGVVFILRFFGTPDFLLVALFVFSVMLMLKADFVIRYINPVLRFVGKYSTYIWLAHTFFGYYFFQRLTFMPRYSWLIFLWCMVLSIASGIVLEGMLTLICKSVRKMFTHRK